MKRIAENLRSTREERFCSALVGLEHFRDKTVTEWIRAMPKETLPECKKRFISPVFSRTRIPHTTGTLIRSCVDNYVAACENSLGVSPCSSQANSYKNVP